MNNVIIIGGGVAGLSEAIHCAQLGMNTVLIEAGTYPAHKICGEFFSPEALPLLEKFGIKPTTYINKIQIFSGNYNCSFSLDKPAGSISRFTFDHALVQVARAYGVQVITDTIVHALRRVGNEYIIDLSSGQKLATSRVIIGTGRVVQLLAPEKKPGSFTPKFIGFKAHWTGIDTCDRVQFYTFPGAYLGVSAIEDGKTNIACLASIDQVNNFKTPELFIDNLLTQIPVKNALGSGKRIFPQWLTCSVPAFGVRENPKLPNIFYIGDAAGTIPPATGDGLAIALTSGQLVAHYVDTYDAAGFLCTWTKKYGPILRNGRLLHQIMLRPSLSKISIQTCNHLPSLARFIFNMTRCLTF